jgi:Rps23 Pro-64 3,4-dihydroxylase Tpa1-like proline 4-hydroxylase
MKKEKIVQKFENFLDEGLYLRCRTTARDKYYKGEQCLKTHRCWQASLVADSAPVLIYDVKGEPELYNDIVKTIREKIDVEFETATINFYYWTRYSYIPWHNDGHAAGAVSIYLNPDWNPNYGGYLLYKEDDEIKAILPEKNVAVFQANGLHHGTTPVNFAGDIRYSIQCFLEKGRNKGPY